MRKKSSIVASGQSAVFLDKDGTVVDDVPYNVDPEMIRLASGAREALRTLHAAGYRLVLISNQSGVALGYFSESALQGALNRVRELLGDFGVPLTGIYYCPHRSDGCVPEPAVACECRKPQPGMILRAAAELGLDLARSWCVGDILDDVEAGKRAGCGTILLNNGHETEWVMSSQRRPDHLATNLSGAAGIILATDHPTPLPKAGKRNVSA